MNRKFDIDKFYKKHMQMIRMQGMIFNIDT